MNRLVLAVFSAGAAFLNVPKPFGGSERFTTFVSDVVTPEKWPHSVPQPHHASFWQSSAT